MHDVKQDELITTSYYRHVAGADRFASRLCEQILELLTTNNITTSVPIEKRVKSLQSIREKIGLKKIPISDVMALDDFVGLRIILLFARDVEEVSKLITTKFVVSSDEDAARKLGGATFGYQSKHFTIQMPKIWCELPRFAGLGEFKAEVQVRTAAQHIWAVASHTLQYKREESIPVDVRRSINRVAALLETVDLEFERVLGERQNYQESAAHILTGSPHHFDEQELNVDLLEKVLDDFLPVKNKNEIELYDDLLRELNDHHITTVGGLKEFIANRSGRALEIEDEIIRRFQKRKRNNKKAYTISTSNGAYNVFVEDIERKGAYFTHTGLLRVMLGD